MPPRHSPLPSAVPPAARDDAGPGETPASGAPTHWAFAGVLTGALAATAAGVGGASPLFAQAPPDRPAAGADRATRRFDIAEGPLTEALAAFARATGVTVADPGALAGTLRSGGAAGTLTDEQALHRLLAGTGVAFRYTSARAVRLERGAALARVTVRAERARELASPKYTAPLRDLPQTVSVVPQQVMAQQGAVTLRDALRNVAGLTVNAGEGGVTPGDNFNVRGFSARSDVFIDGVRDVAGYARETFNVEQVEVAKGPGSAYVGRGSTGGTINLVTKVPHAGADYAGTLGAGSADFGRATVDLNQPLGTLAGGGVAVRLNAAAQDAGVAGLDRVDNRSWGVAPSLALGLGTRTRVVAQLYRNDQRNLPTYGIMSFDSLPSVDTRNFFGLAGLDRERVRASQATLRAEHDVRPGLSLRNQLAWGARSVDRIVTFANAAGGARAARSHLTRDGTLANQTTLSAAFATGVVRHTLATGVDVTRERSRFGGYTITGALPTVIDLNNPNPDDAFAGAVSARRPTRDATATTAGVYLFDTMRMGRRVELTGGLRWDHFRAAYRDSLGAALSPAGTTTRALTWRAGAVYKPARTGSVYAAYGTSFNPTGELLAADSRGTSGLDPERNRSVELGTKWDLLRSRLALTAAAFRTEKTNARIANPADPSGPQLLAGDQRVQGVELGTSGRLARAWTVFGGYTWMDSEVLAGAAADVGKPLPNTPRHTATLWTAYTLPNRLELGAGGRYVGRRFARGTFYVPGYRTFDATTAYPVARSVTLRLNAYNLTDATYYDNGRFWVPGAGRSARLTADVQF